MSTHDMKSEMWMKMDVSLRLTHCGRDVRCHATEDQEWGRSDTGHLWIFRSEGRLECITMMRINSSSMRKDDHQRRYQSKVKTMMRNTRDL